MDLQENTTEKPNKVGVIKLSLAIYDKYLYNKGTFICQTN